MFLPVFIFFIKKLEPFPFSQQMFQNLQFSHLIFFIFKVFGLAPVNFKSSWISHNRTRRWHFSKSTTGSMYNVFLIFAMIIINIVITNSCYKLKFNRINEPNLLLIVIFDMVIPTCSICILIAFTCKRRKIIELGNKINQARELAMFVDKNVYDQKNMFLSDITFNCLTNVIILIGILFFKTTVASDSSDKKCSLVTYYFMILLNISIVTFTLHHYCMIVKIMKNFLTFINENLSKILKEQSWSLEIRVERKTIVENKVDNLIILHDLTCEISRKTSSLYSFPVLLTVFINFLALICSMHHVIKNIFYSHINLSKLSVIVSLVILFMCVSSITMVAVNVTCTVQEVMEKKIFTNFFKYY